MTLDPGRWERIQAIFHDVADLDPAAVDDALGAACGGDAALVAEVRALIDGDARRATLLDRGLPEAADRALGAALPPRFGPYRIVRLLGEGGMGAVYLAHRDDLDAPAAIKILRDAWASPARRDRFLEEQRTLAQLRHPSIARLLDADTLPDGTPWFVMEYVDGLPLTAYAERRHLGAADRLRLLRSVAEAVQFAHRHAVIHRDLKPSNIFVCDDGTVRLLDFGIAKHLQEPGAQGEATRTGLRVMTPAYAAPEQMTGERLGVHSDVYSLGVVLYELLTGKLPYDVADRTPTDAATFIRGRAVPRPSAAARQAEFPLASQLSRSQWADLDVLCLTAMHADPTRRYHSADELIRDIDHFLAGEPLSARPDTVGYRAAKYVGRHWRGLLLTAAVLSAVVGLSVIYTVRLARARNAALAETARTLRIQQFMLDLFQGGDEAVAPPDSMRVITLLASGVQQARALDQEPVVQAELYGTLGGVYQRLGEYSQADTLLRLALARRRALLAPDDPDVARAYVALGMLRLEQAQLDSAEGLIRTGLEVAEAGHPVDRSAEATALGALGRLLEERGAYPAAADTLLAAVHFDSLAQATPADRARDLAELANTEFYAGQYAASDSLNHRLLALYRDQYGERHPLVADALINLGAIQQVRGDYTRAEQYDRQALDITLAWYGPDHPETASAMTIVARDLDHLDRGTEALDLLHKALAIEERVFGAVHPQVASTLNELGTVALAHGQLDEAASDFRRMADIYRTVYHGKHYRIGVALSNLGSVDLAKHRYVDAENAFHDALAMLQQTLPAGHVNIGIARIKLGRALLRQQRSRDAAAQSLAGYEIVRKQATPFASWLQWARKDLVDEYTALGDPDQAARFRAELADSGAPPRGR